MKRLFISLLLLLTPFALIQGEQRGQDSRYVDDKPKIMEELDWLREQEGEDYLNFLYNKLNHMKNMSWWTKHSNTELPLEFGAYVDKEDEEVDENGSRLKIVDFLGESVHQVIQSDLFNMDCKKEFIHFLLSHGGNPYEKPKQLPWDKEDTDKKSLTAYQVAKKEALRVKDHEKASDCIQSILRSFEGFREGFELTAKLRENVNELNNRVEVLVKKTDNTIKETEKFIEEHKKLNDETLENIKKKQATKSND